VLAAKLAMQNCSMSGNLVHVAIPSQVWREVSREGVETRRAAPKPRIIRERVKGYSRPQTGCRASYSIRAAKAVVGKKIRRAQKAGEGSTASANCSSQRLPFVTCEQTLA
jgi:hypothetical protein